MNREDVIEQMVEQHRETLEAKDDEELLGKTLERVREKTIEARVEQFEEELEGESNEELLGDTLDDLREHAIDELVDHYREQLERRSDEELLDEAFGRGCERRRRNRTARRRQVTRVRQNRDRICVLGREGLMFKNGQEVAVKAAGGGDGRMTIAIPATFLRRVGKKLLCKDRSGKKFQINPENVFASMEALEASISALRVAVNTETGRLTTFPADARLRKKARRCGTTVKLARHRYSETWFPTG